MLAHLKIEAIDASKFLFSDGIRCGRSPGWWVWCTRRRRRAGWSPSMAGSTPFAGKKKSAMTNTGPRLLYDSERRLQTPLCFLQIPQGLLHLHDWTLMVLDSVQLCRLFLHILAWLRCGLVNFFFLWAFVLCISSFQNRYIVVLTHGDLRKDLADDHVVCIRNDLFTGKKEWKDFFRCVLTI